MFSRNTASILIIFALMGYMGHPDEEPVLKTCNSMLSMLDGLPLYFVNSVD